jgi:tripartite-type tricarboxylate transporter receptor subunit TctC
MERKNPMSIRNPVIALLLVLLGTVVALPSVLAQNYPTKSVRMIVPHPAGGGPLDGPARGMAEILGRALGQTFVIENRDGADGMIGTEVVVKSAPDGYTLLTTSAAVITLNSFVRANLPYDTTRDLEPIGYIGAINSMILANPSVPAKSLRELLDLAKAKPNSLTWGTLGNTSVGNLLIGLFKKDFDAPFYTIPYKSTVQALLGTVSGDVNVVAYAVGDGTRFAKQGKLRALAITGRDRVADLPDVPTLGDLGINLKFRNWIGTFAPAGTSKDIVRKVNAEMAKGVADPAYRQKFLYTLGVFPDEVSGAPPEKFAEFIKADREGYAEITKAAGIEKR